MDPPNLADLCRRLVEQLDDETRGQLRLLVFQLSLNQEKGSPAENLLGEMYDRLEPKKPKKANQAETLPAKSRTRKGTRSRNREDSHPHGPTKR